MKKEDLYRVSDRCLEYSLYGLILVIPISSAAIEIFFGFLLFFFLLKKASRPDFTFLKSRINIFLFSFIFFSALSLVNGGPYLMKCLRALCSKWAEYVMIFIIAQDALRNSRRRINASISILLGMGFILCIDAFSQHFLHYEFIRGRPLIALIDGSSIFGTTASFQHYNDFGTYLVFIILLAMALCLSGIKRVYKTFFFALSILLVICLLMTFSRGSWLGFLVASLVMSFISRKFKKVLPFIFIFLAILFCVPAIRERVAFTLHPRGDADRFMVWQTAIRMISENPFLGKGVGTFMDYFFAYRPKLFTQYAHNCYLQIWAETGIFSLISFLLFLYALLLKAFKAFKATGNFFVLGLLCGISAFLVQTFFDTQLYSLQLSAFFWLMAGILSVLSDNKAGVNS